MLIPSRDDERYYPPPESAGGWRRNCCYVVPSLDLVVARVGSGPVSWDEQVLIGEVVAAITA